MARYLRPASKLLNRISSVPILKTPNWLATNSFSTYEETLLNISPTKLSLCDNGFRVASEDTGASTATVGLWIQTGSRFETDENNGAAHFIQRLAYKGTNKRSQMDLELEVENLGAQLHAYTTREQTAFYAKCLSKDVPKIVEILSDIIQNMKLGEQEIERERENILLELQDDSKTEEVVFDHMHSVAYQGTPLGKSTLGTPDSIKSLRRQDLVNHINAQFKAPRMVLAAAGGVHHEALVSLAEQHFKELPRDSNSEIDTCRFTGSEVRVRDDDMPAAHMAIAFETLGVSDADYIPLMIASTFVGSWDRTHGGGTHHSSKLALAGAEGGFCHAFQSFNTCYSDAGLWGIYFICEPLTIYEFFYQLHMMWMHMCTDATEFQVERAKNTLRTNLLLQLDGTTSVCDDIGRQILNHGRRIPFHEIDAKIQAVNASMVQDALYRHIYDRCPAVVAVGPCEQLLDYSRIRSSFYRIRL